MFMNPDLQEGERSGFYSMTIYLTAGDDTVPGHAGTAPYAKQRQDGVLNAHRKMAGVTGCAAAVAARQAADGGQGPGRPAGSVLPGGRQREADRHSSNPIRRLRRHRHNPDPGAGAGGVGPHAAVTGPDGKIMLFARNDGTGVSTIHQGKPGL